MAKFTRRHYEEVAEALWSVYNDPELRDLKQVDRVLDELVHTFSNDNPRFDEDLFRQNARSFQ